jgi:predicted ATPase
MLRSQAAHFLIILSWCMMERRRIRPAPGDLLTMDRHLPEMICYVKHLVGAKNPKPWLEMSLSYISP